MAATFLARSKPDSPSHEWSDTLPRTTPEFQQHFQSALALAARGGDPAAASSLAYGMMYRTLIRQATLWAYVDNFRLLGILCVFCIPLVFLFKRVQRRGPVTAH